jgi:hypothetical protein
MECTNSRAGRQRARVAAEGGDFNAHILIKRQRFQEGVQFVVAFDLEDAAVRKPTHDPPQVLPFARALQLGRSLMLELTEPLYGLPINRWWDPDLDHDVEHHRAISGWVEKPVSGASPVTGADGQPNGG